MTVDFVIVGQGLAGTALAWQLRRRGRSVLVVDREAGNSASRVAAGLITPVTGKRMAKSWRWDELYPAAVAFYRALEAKLGAQFFHPREALRLFLDANERERYDQRAATGRERFPPYINRDWFTAPFGGFAMSAARLDVTRYLDLSREHFRAHGAYLLAEIDPARDVELTPSSSLTSPLEGEVGGASPPGGGNGSSGSPPTRNAARSHLPLKGGGQEIGVRLPRLGINARGLIFCRGFAPEVDPWFGAIAFNAAKGEILTLRVPGLEEDRVVHCGVWLAPAGGDIFHVGSTYNRDRLDSLPTAEGRAEIESRLRAFLRLRYEVIDHRAAVRPVIDAGFPVLGRHPNVPQLAYFNGLGSKGSLLAPFFADQLAANLVGEGEIEMEVDVGKLLR